MQQEETGRYIQDVLVAEVQFAGRSIQEKLMQTTCSAGAGIRAGMERCRTEAEKQMYDRLLLALCGRNYEGLCHESGARITSEWRLHEITETGRCFMADVLGSDPTVIGNGLKILYEDKNTDTDFLEETICDIIGVTYKFIINRIKED